jgi:MtN3 and saliva related transmembrane protein
MKMAAGRRRICASSYQINSKLTITMNLTDLLGYLAATLTTLSFVPQALKTFRSKDVSGISLGMYSLFAAGVAAWLAYGWLLRAWPIVAANVITLSLAGAILLMKFRYKNHSKH